MRSLKLESEAQNRYLKRIVLIAVNPTSDPIRAKLEISHTTAPLNYDAHETSASRGLEKAAGNIAVDHGTFAAKSVTTLVFDQRMPRSETLNR